MAGIIVGDADIAIDGDGLMPFIVGHRLVINDVLYEVESDKEVLTKKGEAHLIHLKRCD